MGYDRCHPNAAAHKLLADELFSRMKGRMYEVLDGKRPPAGYNMKSFHQV